MPQQSSKDNGETQAVNGKPAKEFPPPKTDKPRPHVCAICSRSFARLEHLKRHERSHTKEKPFECPECTRCFARRDLLLRHQQKLHMTTTPSSRPRNGGGRRESMSAVGTTSGGRVRKNSVSGNAMRPRANTISHVDATTLAMTSVVPNVPGDVGGSKIDAAANKFRPLDAIDTTTISPGSMLPQDIDIEGILFGSSATVNPAVLHFSASPQQAIGTPTSPFDHIFPSMNSSQVLQDDEDDFEWMNMLGTDQLNRHNSAAEGSSPSAISTASAGLLNETAIENPAWWNLATTAMNTSPFTSGTDFTSPAFNTSPPPAGTVSPKALQNDQQFFALSPAGLLTHLPNAFPSPLQAHFPTDPSTFSAPAFSLASQSITESNRTTLLATIAQASSFSNSALHAQHHRRYSFSHVTSTLNGSKPLYNFSLPSTHELQRYVEAYIKYFHPHLPFLHIPTLDFSSSSYRNNYKGDILASDNGFSGGGGCLVLSVAAIGALFETDYMVAKEIFEAGKKMIHIFLEDRRKATSTATDSNNTPLWLVQAMLLNVMFGLHSGENIGSDLAQTHCAAVVALARSAGLCKSATPTTAQMKTEADINMAVDSIGGLEISDSWGMGITTELPDDHGEWSKWIVEEERKRTLYAVHQLSSMLCITHNHAPALTNSEIRLDLPCDEDLWAAESPTMWKIRGGPLAISQSSIPFSIALNTLLSAGGPQEARRRRSSSSSYSQSIQTHLTPSQLRPSHFGALSLILALHVYIWETRQLSHARQWSSTEVEAIHAHIEPALRAWEEAWASHPQSNIERPNPFGTGPLASDSIPLLDLAYIRLFVDLGRSRTQLFAKDFPGMVDALSKNWVDQNTGSSSSPSSGSELTDTPQSATSPASSPTSTVESPKIMPTTKPTPPLNNLAPANSMTVSSRHEKHLRRAAFYAADALQMSEKLGLSSSDCNSRELPMQALVCSFDCAQVLAEWLNSIQERVRPFMGELGDPNCDISGLESLMILEPDDRVLLGRIIDILKNSERKMGTTEWEAVFGGTNEVSLSTKILKLTAFTLEKAGVWPVLRVFSAALRFHSENIEKRPKNNAVLGLV